MSQVELINNFKFNNILKYKAYHFPPILGEHCLSCVSRGGERLLSESQERGTVFRKVSGGGGGGNLRLCLPYASQIRALPSVCVSR